MTKPKSFNLKGLVLPVFLPSTLFAIGDASLLPIIPTAAEKLGADLPTAGLIAGMITFGALACVLPAARLVNRFGERRSMIFAGVVGTLSSASLLFANTLWMMAIAVFISGGMEAVFGLARHGYMTEHVPFSYRARALAILGGTFRAGGFLGPLMGAGMVALFGVQSAFAVAAAMCALSVVVLLFQKDDAKSKPDTSQKTAIFQVAKREIAKLRTIGVLSAILIFVRTARQIGLPLWGIYLGMHPAEISLYIGIAGALDFALFYASGQVIDRFGRRASAVPTMFALGMAMICITLATTPTLFLTVAIGMSIANALGSGIMLTLGSDLAPVQGRNEFLAAYRMLSDAGAAAAPLALSGLTVAFSLPIAFVAIGIMSIVGAYGMWHFLPKFGIR